MAVTTQWTSNINTRHLPVGATIPTVAELVDPIEKEFSIDLPAATYDNVVPTTAWTAIGNAVKTEIDTNWVSAEYGIDAAKTVTGRILITEVRRRNAEFENEALRAQYGIGTPVYRVKGIFQWTVA
jgi:hypothetical protein